MQCKIGKGQIALSMDRAENTTGSQNPDFLTRFGKLALVTGASSGIGAAFARLLAERGFDLLLVARREGRLRELQSELQHYGGHIEYLALDLSSPTAVSEIVAALKERDLEPSLGLVISNAGFGLKGGFNSSDIANIDSMLNVNARTPVLLLHALLPGLCARGRGGVILTGSQEGESPCPWSAAYAATKAFVHNFGLSLHGDLKGTGVDLLVLAPGATDTEAGPLQGFDMSKLPGLMTPQDVAAQALAALGSRPLFIPGWRNRLMIGLFRLLPRRWSIALSGTGMAKALKEHGHPVKRPETLR